MNMEEYFSGKTLYGDHFDENQIKNWFEDEEEGFYNLINGFYFEGDADYQYEFHALNDFHAFRHLRNRSFKHCLALGCARGDDVTPLAPQIDRFTCVEPAEKWWKDEIGGKPAQFVKPKLDGNIPCADAACDLAVSLSVLHHIPNVSAVIEEVSRVLQPGGTFILHEPVISMGDWRLPRLGLTKNERGLPLGWLRTTLDRAGFEIERTSFCQIPTTPRLSRLLNLGDYNSRAVVLQDYILSALMRWNLRYHRTTTLQKLCPTSVFMMVRRR